MLIHSLSPSFSAANSLNDQSEVVSWGRAQGHQLLSALCIVPRKHAVFHYFFLSLWCNILLEGIELSSKAADWLVWLLFPGSLYKGELQVPSSTNTFKNSAGNQWQEQLNPAKNCSSNARPANAVHVSRDTTTASGKYISLVVLMVSKVEDSIDLQKLSK